MGFLDTAQRKMGFYGSDSSHPGVGTTPAGGGRRGGLGTGVLANLADDDDGTGWPNLILRGTQVFLAFVDLCIYIALAVAQKGNGHIAGMTGWGLFFDVEVLLHAAAFLATPLVYDRFSVLGGFARFLRQVRAGLIINTTQCIILLIACIASSVTASKCGTALCTPQRAAAAFLWLQLFTWLASLTLVGLGWYQERTDPRSQPFVQPTEHDDPFDAAELESAPHTAYAAGGGYRPSGDYYEVEGGGEGGVFGERVQEYEGVGGQRFEEEEEDKYRPRVGDPFAEVGGGQAWQREGDPYEAIRKSMERANPRPSY